VQFTFASLPAALPHVRAARVRAIAVGSAKRVAVLPNVPTVAEVALPGFDISAWNGVLAPRATPPAIVSKLNAEVRRIAALPDMKERAAAQGAELATNSPQEFTRFIEAQIVKWAGVAKSSGMNAN